MREQVSVSGDHALALTCDCALEYAVVVLIIGHDMQALGGHNAHGAGLDVGTIGR